MSNNNSCGYYLPDEDDLFLDPLYDEDDTESHCWRDYTKTLSNEELDWSRNRQVEWYDLFREEHDLSEEDYVDEQDILDWLGAKFTITRLVVQEI